MSSTNENNKRKEDYRPIPDVEAGKATQGPSVNQEKATEQAKKRYPDLSLDNEQARLVGTLDEVMKHAKLDLNLPQISSQEMQTTAESWLQQGKVFLTGMLQPTITAIVTFGVALYLEGQQRVEGAQEKGQQRIQDTEDQFMAIWTQYAVLLFPYVNATLVFCAMVQPIIKRCMMMVQPVFEAMDHAEDSLQATVKRLGPFVDETIDGIQKDFHTVLKPIKPSLDQIESKAKLIEKVLDNRGGEKEDLDIPDPSDIDRELDEAQGIVTTKIEEGRKHLKVEQYIPAYVSSPKQFFWRIVFPVVVLAWIIQMAVAFTTEYVIHHTSSSSSSVKSSPPPATTAPDGRALLYELHDLTLDDLQYEKITAYDFKDSSELDEARIHEADYHSKMGDSMDNATEHNLQDYRARAHEEYEQYSEMANQTMHSLRDNVTDLLHGYGQNFQHQYHQYKGELDSAVAQSKSLVQDVIWSYVVSILQMLLIFVFTSPIVQAWILRQGINQIQKGAERTLKEYGVSDALEDVLGTRLGRVREKILKLLQVYKRVEQVLEEVGAMDNVLPGANSAQKMAETLSGEAVHEAMEKAKKGKFFGRFFNK